MQQYKYYISDRISISTDCKILSAGFRVDSSVQNRKQNATAKGKKNKNAQGKRKD